MYRYTTWLEQELGVVLPYTMNTGGHASNLIMSYLLVVS